MKRPEPICQNAMIASGVPRSARVTMRKKAYMTLPRRATAAGQPKWLAAGCSAITTPPKPTITAVHRRQPTFSRRRSAASTVT